MQTKRLIGLLVRFTLLMAAVAPVYVAGDLLAAPELAVSAAAISVTLTFFWFQEDLVAWIGGRLGLLFPRRMGPAK
jgi:hypothetical protein